MNIDKHLKGHRIFPTNVFQYRIEDVVSHFMSAKYSFLLRKNMTSDNSLWFMKYATFFIWVFICMSYKFFNL